MPWAITNCLSLVVVVASRSTKTVKVCQAALFFLLLSELNRMMNAYLTQPRAGDEEINDEAGTYISGLGAAGSCRVRLAKGSLD
jgi:hypothetical protein